jgi:ribosomal RNA-processing protein 9
MSSFFTLPASQKKRKRSQPTDRTPASRSKPTGRREARDESISGSEESDNDAPPGAEDYSDSEDEDLKDEDPAAKRIRLAEQYLANTQKEILDDGGFDAADVDKENLRRRMGERLQEDTAESKGRIYRYIADELDWSKAEPAQFRADTKGVTGVAVSGRYVYTVTQDRALIKWEMPADEGEDASSSRSTSRKPKKLLFTRGNKDSKDHHQKAILCVAASQDGRFVATGGVDNKLIVWDPATLKPLRIFTGFLRDNGHRDSVLSLAFRRGTNQLFSASKDRTVKIWSLDELAYVETLFGHQDEVVDVSALAQEVCVSVGGRDRTGRFWKVVEESQLVFRGGGAGGTKFRGAKGAERNSAVELAPEDKPYNEGSMDRVACIDDDTFITGSDNGALSLWNIHKKKAVFTYPLAHGLEPPRPLAERSAEFDLTQTLDAEGPMINDPQPRWITALKAIPFSDVFVTGSWDGQVRAWRISSDKRRIEPLGPLSAVDDDLHAALKDAGIPSAGLTDEAMQAIKRGAGVSDSPVRGVVNDLAIVDKDEQRGKGAIYVLAAVGKEHRLGRWTSFGGKNGAVLFEVPRKVLVGGDTTSSA